MSDDLFILCCDCEQQFLFSAGEQDFYAEKQLTPPKRCKPCRVAKKAAIANRTYRPRQEQQGTNEQPPEDSLA